MTTGAARMRGAGAALWGVLALSCTALAQPQAEPAAAARAAGVGGAGSAAAQAPQPSGSGSGLVRIQAQRLSPSARLSYQLKTNKLPFTLHAELLWRNQSERYSAELRYSLLGRSRVQTSQGRITADGLTPQRFTETRRDTAVADFQAAPGRVRFSAGAPDAALQTGAQDRLSVLLQLGAVLASRPDDAWAAGTTLRLQTVGTRSAQVWTFEVMGWEQLDLPGGPLSALKLQRQPREPDGQTVELWLAPALHHLPARVRITEANGDQVDQRWSATEALPDGP